MGQRTATLVTYIDGDGKKTNKVYYNQWGIGRVQTNALLGNFLAQMGQPKFDLSGTSGMYDETKDLVGVEDADFTDIQQVHDVIAQMDNNDGGIVMVVNDKDITIKMGFLIGWDEIGDEEEEKAFSRFVPFEEWVERVGKPYFDEDYKEMFLGFCKHFHVSFINEEDHATDND